MPFGGSSRNAKATFKRELALASKPKKQFGGHGLPVRKPTKDLATSSKQKFGSAPATKKVVVSDGFSLERKSPFDPRLKPSNHPGFLKITESPKYSDSEKKFSPVLCFYPFEQSFNKYNVIFDLFGNIYTTKTIYKGDLFKLPLRYTPTFESKAFLQFEKFQNLKNGSDEEFRNVDISYFLKFCRIKTIDGKNRIQRSGNFDLSQEVLSSENKVKPGQISHQFPEFGYVPKNQFKAKEKIDAGTLLLFYPDIKKCTIRELFNEKETEDLFTIFL